jgi:hypothetical protein
VKKTLGLIVLAAGFVAGCAAEPPAAPVASTRAPTDAVRNASTVDFASAHVIAEYSAASGRRCREYTVDGDHETHLACAAAQGWVEIRPLIRAERTSTP